MQKAENMGLVYISTTYWLASPCVYAFFSNDCVNFSVRCVNANTVFIYNMFCSRGGYTSFTNVIRPVVSLNSNVALTKESAGVWKIS